MDEIESLIHQLEEARDGIRAALPEIDRRKDIYPGWTIKELLAHMTGWDDALIAAIRAHIGGDEIGTPAARGIDVYNAETVSTREAIDYEATRLEWERTRQILIETLRSVPEDKFRTPLVYPWGGEGTISRMIGVFIHHETAEHGNDLREWLKDQEQPLLDRH
ncbi:MAG: maleylpyruvate isomerase N-terminal domain-containing protein [Chloroflexota bacterium]